MIDVGKLKKGMVLVGRGGEEWTVVGLVEDLLVTKNQMGDYNVWEPSYYQRWTIKEEWVEVTWACHVGEYDSNQSFAQGRLTIIYHKEGDYENKARGYKVEGLRVYKRKEYGE